MRGPDKRVRQFRVRRRIVFAAPVALLLLFAAGLALLQARASWQLAALQREMAEQNALHRAAIAAKDGQIRALEDEVRTLSDHQDALEERLRDLRELERRLEDLMRRYGDGADAAGEADAAGHADTPVASSGSNMAGGAGEPDGSSRDGTAAGPDAADPAEGAAAANDAAAPVPSSARGGEAAPAPPDKTAADMIRMLNADEPDFRALTGMVDELDRSVALRIEAERLRRLEADALPSAWPTRSRQVTSPYGYRRDPLTGELAFHDGIDISGRKGDPVYAAGDGTVEETGYDSTRGRYIVIAHRGGLRSRYYHLSAVEAEPGDQVKRGERIGALGSSGRSTGPHLHFAVEADGESVSPLDYLELVKED